MDVGIHTRYNVVVLKVLVAAICGSDLHAYNGRSYARGGQLIFGHEITGEVFEVGPAVQNFKIGDWASVPFTLNCGTCGNCKEQKSVSFFLRCM